MGHSSRKSQYPTRIVASSQKNEGCWIEIQFEGGRAAKFWSLHLARPRRDPPTRRLPAGSLHRRILAHKSQGKWCTRRTPFFILRCAWKRLEESESSQPTLLQPRGTIPRGVNCKKRLASLTKTRSPDGVTSSPLCNRRAFRFCTHSVSQSVERRVTHYLVLAACDLKAPTGRLPQK